ncbi:unnamed protein product [Caenorhabditis bovis]|uniref:Sodium/hydrogen exchanger n=1 Tax=Caenorhabditis bovis TaxID=2654633 RepID=A0A8S1ER31_9PELO|nr:unnamed protein product [Caenorhabditis bovis]
MRKALILSLLAIVALAAPNDTIEISKKMAAININRSEPLSTSTSEQNVHSETEPSHGVKVASFKWDYVKEPLVLTFFFIIIGIFKLVYHHTRYTKKLLPESCLLILLGMLLGVIFIGDKTHESIKFLEFNSKTFFFFLLPPIILESAYSLKDRAFIENFGTIVLYAVVGTVLNIVLIGGMLLLLGAIGLIGGMNLSVLDTFVFASLIAAVDPVAVLAVFQEVGVNKMLYFMVFGESLLNDAVTIVCYNLAIEFQELPYFSFVDCVLGFLAFLCVSLGGLLIGIVCGVISSFITKFTQDVRVVEPVVIFGMAYLAYLISELFHFSGIIGLIACGLFQTHYACCNISYKSFSSVMYFTKVMSSLSEALIFIILGVMLVNEQEWFWEDWHPIFSLCSVILCVLVRFAVTFSLTYVVNQFTGGVRHISFQEQFIMAYGGLRGAVSFSLAFMITSNDDVKNTILAATYMVILFTVFIQGSTMKVLVKLLNINLAGKDNNYRLFLEFNKGMIQHLSQGIEDLCGYKNYNWINQSSEISKRYIRPILEKNYVPELKSEGKLVQMDRAYTMREAMINSPSQSSFKRQQTIDEFADAGVLPLDMLDDERFTAPISREEIEKQTEALTKNVESIRQLLSNPFEECYLDRNLTHEEEKEKKRIEHVKLLQNRANSISGVKKKKNRMFGRKTSVRTNATEQGLIHSAIAAIGIQSVPRQQPTSSGGDPDDAGLSMTTNEDHPLMTITETDETAC